MQTYMNSRPKGKPLKVSKMQFLMYMYIVIYEGNASPDVLQNKSPAALLQIQMPRCDVGEKNI